MQIIFIRLGIIVVALVCTITLYVLLFHKTRVGSEGDILWEGYEVIEKEVEGEKMKLVVADTGARWQQGLMHIRKPVAFDGMIFTSKRAMPQMFWNMNTFEDIDIYWIRDGKIIGKSFLPSIEKKGMTTVASPGPADSVIEVLRK